MINERKTKYLQEVVGKKIESVEVLEDGVSDKYFFILDDGIKLMVSHDDGEGAVWIDRSPNEKKGKT